MAIQPLPFADIFILTPIQACFAARIAALRGVPVGKSETSDLLKEIAGIVGLGLLAQQIAIGVWKLITLGLGAVLTIPLVYSLTFAMMKVADAYFLAKVRGEKLTKEQIKTIYSNPRQSGRPIEGKEHVRILYDAITNATESVCILSGWIGDNVVTEPFIQHLRQAMARGVNIYVGYGYRSPSGKHDPLRGSRIALDRFRSLQREAAHYSGHLFIREFSNHEKCLVQDDVMYVCGSFNWLCNTSCRNNERSECVYEPERCLRERDRIIKLVAGPSP